MSSTPPPPAADADLSELLGPALASAFAKKGYATLTPVQRSVLDPALAGRDLRISSQTGSGKTLAIGLVLRDAVQDPLPPAQNARPRALVIVPTRELAVQVRDELTWLYAPLSLRIAVVTGGSSYREEHRSLARGPAIVVGTPGRLLDHLNRQVIDTSALKSVVLDEADRMLDLGFKDDLENILKLVPEGHSTHLVSATFAREVAALADRFQKRAARVEGTPLGTANADIDHLIYLALPNERVAALVNVLLYHPEEQTLIFARTRADVADITRELQAAGFSAGALSGEMEQAARVRALSAFKRGDLRALVATDVAARGIDVQDIARVVQLDAPNDVDTYTHRSGRTGRAGRKGVSALLVPPAALRRAVSMLQHAGVRFRIERLPTADQIREAQDQRWLAELSAQAEQASPRIERLVERIQQEQLEGRALLTLISRLHQSVGEPREVTPINPQDRARAAQGRGAVRERGAPGRAAPERSRNFRDNGPPSRDSRAPSRDGAESGYVPFHITWGESHGADPRRLVAMLCRRGNINGSDIGAIRVQPTSSVVDVRADVAAGFAEATRDADPRDPRVRISPFDPGRRAGPEHAPRWRHRDDAAPPREREDAGAPRGFRKQTALREAPRVAEQPSATPKAAHPKKSQPKAAAQAPAAEEAPRGGVFVPKRFAKKKASRA